MCRHILDRKNKVKIFLLSVLMYSSTVVPKSVYDVTMYIEISMIVEREKCVDSNKHNDNHLLDTSNF